MTRERPLRTKRRLMPWLSVATLLLATLLPGGANAASILALQDPPTPMPPLTESTARPLLENGVPVDVRLVDPDPVVLSADEVDAPAITVWHGDGDTFGQNGRPNPVVNIVGNVQPANDITLLRYRLNGGAFTALSVGPDPGAPDEGGPRRVYDPGDFNIEIPWTALNSGDNTILINAQQGDGSSSDKTVTFTVVKDVNWSLPTVINWGESANVNDSAQVVDGHWEIVNNPAIGPSVRSIQYGYDRLVALGGLVWTDYEVTVPVVVNAISIDGPAYSTPSNGPGVGLILRWPGHYQVATEDPFTGWTDLGALGWFHYGTLGTGVSTAMELITTTGGFNIAQSTAKTLGTDAPHYLKLQVQTSGDKPTYRMKAWPLAQPEPAGWDLSYELPADIPAAGSILLVAHHVDANFGQVQVTPLNYTANVTINNAPNGSASVAPQQASYQFYDSVTASATASPGYIFTNWTGTVTDADGNATPVASTQNPYTFNVLGDTVLTPNFMEAAYTIDVTTIGEGDVNRNPPGPAYSEGEIVTLTAQPDAGWLFDRWEGSASGSNPTTTVAVDGNEAVTAYFAPEYYTLTKSAVDESGNSAAGAGSINAAPPASQNGYIYGEQVTLQAIPATGWEFVRWEGDASGSNAATSIQIQGNATVRAVFARQSVTLSTNTQGEGRVTLSPNGPYRYGDTVTIAALADGGWLFTGWQGDVPNGDRQSPQVTLTLAGDAAVTAVFEELSQQLFLPVIRN